MMDAAREAVTHEARLAVENAQLEARNAELHALRGELVRLGGRPEGLMVQWNTGEQ